MRLQILTPERKVVDEEIRSLSAHAVDGSFGILENHVALITPLKVSVLHFDRVSGERHHVAVMGGMLQTDGKTVTVLTEMAELGHEVDVVKAKEEQERALARMKERLDHLEVGEVEMSLARATTRLKAAGKL